MIIEEEGKAICSYTTNDILNPPAVIQVGSPAYFSRVLEIQNRETHHNLRHDLTEYIWERQFQGQNDGEDDDDDDGDDGDDGGDEVDDTGDDNDDD
ncbi:phosphopantothenoylcysteine decarboxylase subunit VHS3-like [Lactuca sativa]|uniref:phosphopantothenoylcysteine decarboxylase subunit VHS3-like n=1 Tax=Lactuca sativa TaxID=4236 RepID=UPI000CD92650|nr:phosphopantothenoylcysteine decarboxylase subunit VHS3-like [Lactuca sativa]